MKKINPLITVYITNYNYGKFVKKAINSVLNQTFKNFNTDVKDLKVSLEYEVDNLQTF